MLRRLVAPTDTVVTLEEAKAHIRVDHAAEDDLIAKLLEAAIDTCADSAGRAFNPTSYEWSGGCWPACGFVDLPLAPVQSVVGVSYVDEAGDQIDLTEETDWKWISTSAGARVRFSPDFSGAWPTLGSDFDADGRQVRIEFVAGYELPDDVDYETSGELILPGQARSAILLTLGHLYANRESVIIGKSAIELPLGALHLLNQIRIYR